MIRKVFPNRKLTEKKLRILVAISKCEKTYKREIERLTGLGVRTVATTVDELKVRGLVEFQEHNIFITDAGIALVEEYLEQQEEKIRNHCSV
jgi:DNA-binding MarR family transcriptional regulator